MTSAKALEEAADAGEHAAPAAAVSPSWQLAGRAMPPTGMDGLYATLAMKWGWDAGWRPIALVRACVHCARDTNLAGPDGRAQHPRCAEQALA